jgi:hypothetical protein
MTQPKSSKKKTPAKVYQPKREFPVVPVAIIGGLVLLVALIVYAAYAASQPVQPIEGLLSYPGVSASHIEDPVVIYDQLPPVGGPHNSVWQNCGVYTRELENRHAVHSLEHGAIWITYSPDLPEDQVLKLQSITRQSQFRLLSPYPGLPSPIVASAWGYQIQLDSPDDPRLSQFIDRYEQKGPEAASCNGGIGNPE